MLSARSQEEDIVHALSLGADDYITKPFSPRTLVARIRALLRRAATADITSIEAGGATLDIERNELHVADIDVQLTPLETRVLNALFRHAGRLVTSDRLAAEAWGRAGAEERHALKQVVYRLRRKLEDTTSFQDLLETTRGAGYRWVGRGLSLRVETRIPDRAPPSRPFGTAWRRPRTNFAFYDAGNTSEATDGVTAAPLASTRGRFPLGRRRTDAHQEENCRHRRRLQWRGAGDGAAAPRRRGPRDRVVRIDRSVSDAGSPTAPLRGARAEHARVRR